MIKKVEPYILTYTLLIVVELIVVCLTRMEILALNYGWEARMNMVQVISIAAIQALILVLTLKVEKEDMKVSILQAQSLLYLLAVVWIGTEIEIDYRLLR